ncbi:MerC domain-containing protein [Sphingomonas sp. CJ20]
MAVTARRREIYDGMAIGASILCLIHCLLLPLLIVLVPTLAAFLAVPESFHLWALAFAVPSSVGALGTGYRRHHELRPIVIVIPGIVLLSVGAIAASSEWMETALTVPGALLLAIGHAVNWRAMRHAGSPAGEHAI